MRLKIGRIERQTQSNILGRSKTPLSKRPVPCGQHGKARAVKKVSEFGRRLVEGKKFRTLYNLSGKQLKNLIVKVSKTKGQKQSNLIEIVERKLETFVFRAKFTVSPMAARQLIVHGNVLINNKVITYPSYQLKVNDIVTISDRLHSNPHIMAAMSGPRKIPNYIEINGFKAKLIEKPSLVNVEFYAPIKINEIMEYNR